ncbi:MAG: hypothetical protein PF961_08105 [Planctomycetota bacterium]|jgi:hypothetical protein|nr:hypothetical protein [Planctomycetota bacterium]
MHHLFSAIRAQRNRGTRHVFLGHPLSDACDKTTVEPGNHYSPGVWTCGVGLWLSVAGGPWRSQLELDESQLRWAWNAEGGFTPVLEAWYELDAVTVSHRLAHQGGPGSTGVDGNVINLSSAAACTVQVAIAVCGNGPCGGPVAGFGVDEGVLTIGSGLRLRCEQDVQIIIDEHEDPIAVVLCTCALEPAAPVGISFVTEHGGLGRRWGDLEPGVEPRAAAALVGSAVADWPTSVPARIVCSADPRVARSWQAAAHHILTAMECGVPRIGCVNYPTYWLRDGVLVLRALDLIGRHDLARSGAEALLPMEFGGGFGAEADAPGEAIWALVQHAVLTADDAWLAEAFPFIVRRVRWIERMARASGPIRLAADGRHAGVANEPMSTVLCCAAAHGLVDGRMDGHHPNFFINSWCVGGLRMAAVAAQRLGRGDEASDWHAQADAMEAALAQHLLPGFGNDRDTIITPWPSGALAEHPPLRAAFAEKFRQQYIGSEGQRQPAKKWTYFEAASCHNAFLLGLADEAWCLLDGLLGDDVDVVAFVEGPPLGNEHLPFRNDRGADGWLGEASIAGNMPHNWSNAELIACLRDCVVRDDGDALVLAPHLPEAWLVPGASVSVSDLPTRFGPISYQLLVANDGARSLSYTGPAARCPLVEMSSCL